MRSDNQGNCRKEDLLLYAVTDRSWLNGESLYDQVEKALKGGVTFVQLREKNLDEEAFLEEAKEIKKLCAQYRVPFVINDNVGIAAQIRMWRPVNCTTFIFTLSGEWCGKPVLWA